MNFIHRFGLGSNMVENIFFKATSGGECVETYTNGVPYFNRIREKAVHISSLVNRNLVIFV